MHYLHLCYFHFLTHTRRQQKFNTSKKDEAQTSKEHFKIDLIVTSHLLFVEHSDLHPMKSTPLNEHAHVYFMNTHVDCLTTWLVPKKFSVLGFPCRSAKKVQNWIWDGIINFISVGTKMAGTSWKDLVLALLAVASLLCCSVLSLSGVSLLFHNHVFFTTVIQQRLGTIASGTQPFLNLL